MARTADTSNCLHLVLSAGGDAIEECRRAARPGDTLYFADDGVRHLLVDDACPAGCVAAWSAPCVAARGLQPAARQRRAQLADDAEFTRLLRRHAHCLSWT